MTTLVRKPYTLNRIVFSANAPFPATLARLEFFALARSLAVAERLQAQTVLALDFDRALGLWLNGVPYVMKTPRHRQYLGPTETDPFVGTALRAVFSFRLCDAQGTTAVAETDVLRINGRELSAGETKAVRALFAAGTPTRMKLDMFSVQDRIASHPGLKPGETWRICRGFDNLTAGLETSVVSPEVVFLCLTLIERVLFRDPPPGPRLDEGQLNVLGTVCLLTAHHYVNEWVWTEAVEWDEWGQGWTLDEVFLPDPEDQSQEAKNKASEFSRVERKVLRAVAYVVAPLSFSRIQ